ncbi:MAG: DUF6607 family protein [Parasphingopyxis sp.]
MTTSKWKTALLGAAMLGAMPLAPALADRPVAEATAAEDQASFEADRAIILSMAGNYRVSFDMQESTSWRSDYAAIAPKMSGGFENVRVIEDTGRTIVLQHILVVGTEDDPVVVKHWRQDWVYEPETYLAYEGEGVWTVHDVPERMRRGRWSQTVWQVDDSPRYGGWGEWTEEGGVPRWRSNWTLRPLARRDAVREPVYDRYLSINRHSPTPGGWIHWQDNIKQGLVDGETVPFVQEYVLNTYSRTENYDPAPGDSYWANTARYWAAVRAAWAEVIAANGGITLTEEPNMGNTIASTIYTLAQDIDAGTREEAAAIAEAQAVIRASHGGTD